MLPPQDTPTGGAESPYGASARPPLEAGSPPAPGELGIKEQRSWKTWQLAMAMLAAALVGMALNYHTVGATSSGGGNSGNSYTLPPPSGSSATTTTTAAGGTHGATTTTATSASTSSNSSSSSGSTSTTTPATTTTTTPPVARVLLGPSKSSGNWTSPAFTVTNPSWNIGWAFQCTPAPTAGTSFVVYVVPVGGWASGTPALSETGGSGQSVTAQTTVGQQELMVQAPANCVWVVKVTGS
jgi:hypothetical protein